MKGKLYVYRQGRGLVEVQRAKYKAVAPNIRCDTIPLEYCHGTGQWYDSRSRRDMELKVAGVETVDIDWHPNIDPHAVDEADLENDIRESFREVQWGEAEPLNENERAMAASIDKVIDAGK